MNTKKIQNWKNPNTPAQSDNPAGLSLVDTFLLNKVQGGATNYVTSCIPDPISITVKFPGGEGTNVWCPGDTVVLF